MHLGLANSPLKELAVDDSISIKHVDEGIPLLRQLKAFNCVSRLVSGVTRLRPGVAGGD